ncbi:class I SAM-dependent methyltransferase [Streptomyces sp. NPDC059409]|uniref:class I SAM-dependent methyltransferase n=1 Tax=Streptomyces sp. NPDC059409 TaxID=3346824 RepID=UPI0036B2278F
MTDSATSRGAGRTPPPATANDQFEAAYRGTARAGSRLAELPWETGEPQPVVVRLAAQGAFHGDILDVGCGTGDNTLHLASLGHCVTGVDFALSAINTALAKQRRRGLKATFAVADACELDGYEAAFDCVLDCGLLHSLPVERRASYLWALRRATRPDAVAHILCLTDRMAPHGTLQPLSEEELRKLFGRNWKVESLTPETLVGRSAGEPVSLPCWHLTVRRLR